jgi:uncharacterized protein YdeI (YjbR/CyaY-like superfamily)
MKSMKVGDEVETPVPPDLSEALRAAPIAEAAWKDLTAIGRRDFISWIETAKQAETRTRRIRIACEKLIAGQRRPCCYAVVPMDLYKALGIDPAAKAMWSKLTPDERRDFSDWLETAKERDVRKGRVQEICAMLTAGKRQP